MLAGVPQGSTLSPMLYNLYTWDIPGSIRTELSVYTDNIYIYHKKRSARFAHLVVQLHLNEIGRWANKWRIYTIAEKRKAVVFSKRKRLQLPVLKLHGEIIEYVPRCPYLGVILDRGMNWKVLRDKSHESLTALSPLLRSSLSSRAQLIIYKTYIRPFLKSRMRLLQTVQKMALRLIGGYDRFKRIEEIYSGLEIIKLESFMKYLALTLYYSARSSRNKYIKRLGTDTLVDNRRVPKPVHIID